MQLQDGGDLIHYYVARIDGCCNYKKSETNSTWAVLIADESKSELYSLTNMDLGQINWFDFLILDYQEKAQIILNLLLLASTFGLQPVSSTHRY